jgi:hypothetical protein
VSGSPQKVHLLLVTDEPRLDAMVAELERTGLLVIGRDADGAQTWTLTAKGVQLAHQLAMPTLDGGQELLSALLDAVERPNTQARQKGTGGRTSWPAGSGDLLAGDLPAGQGHAGQPHRAGDGPFERAGVAHQARADRAAPEVVGGAR